MYPIHVAAALGNAHILRMLLDAGADPTRRVDGKTAEGIWVVVWNVFFFNPQGTYTDRSPSIVLWARFEPSTRNC